MHRSHAAHTLVLAVVLSAATLAQTPNFTGKWAVVPDPSSQGSGGAWGQSAVIKQDATTLTVTRTTQMGEVTSVYKLDGSESKNTLNFQGNAIDQLSRVKMGRRHAEGRHEHELRRQSRQRDDGDVARRVGQPRRGVNTPGLPGRRRPGHDEGDVQESGIGRGRTPQSGNAFTRRAALQLGSTLVCVSGRVSGSRS